VRYLDAAGWTVLTEVSFAVLGERGSIDVFARHAATGALLAVEVKTVVPDWQGMLAAIDRMYT
jgi:Holliday junction resolvase-like predicted endonuclease